MRMTVLPERRAGMRALTWIKSVERSERSAEGAKLSGVPRAAAAELTGELRALNEISQ